MPACDQVKLLLGPFDDGELEPHEMEDIAFHVVTCLGCKATLDDYRTLGVALRDCTPELAMAGFSTAVMRRIDQVPQPLWRHWQHYRDVMAGWMSGTLPLIGAGALAALLTVWLVTPFARHWLYRSTNAVQIAASETGSSHQGSFPDQAESSMITLSSDPSTAVIWLPNP